MIPVRTASQLLAVVTLISLGSNGVAQAQASLADQKTQAEIEKLEAEKQKVVSDMIGSSRSATAGSATLATPELTAEGLMLSRHVQEQTAKTVVAALGNPAGRISVVFGEQPASTAEYLGLKRGSQALHENLRHAAKQGRDLYKQSAPICASITTPPKGGPQHTKFLMAFPGIGLALSAVTTVASLLRVNTTVTGAALQVPNEQYKAVLVQELLRKGWAVDPLRSITTKTPYADKLMDDMACAKDEAANYYSIYQAHLAQKDGKPANLPLNELIVGKALETALTDYATLEKGLFTPVNGVLPASIVEEQKTLVDSAATRRILYIQHHKAALTSITKQGTFTGIVGVPAYVSASHVVEYAVQRPEGDLYSTVRYDTPLMKVTGVKAWLAPGTSAAAPKGG